MRVDHIEVINLRFTYPPGAQFAYAGGIATGRLSTLVRVHDNRGRIGIGSAYTHPELARVVIQGQLEPWLLGRTINDVTIQWDEMMRLVRWYGRSGAAVSALGAIDTALWDLAAQEARQPLWRFLGGTEQSVAAYASGLLWHDQLTLLQQEASAHLDSGFTQVKMRLGRCRDYDLAAFLAVNEAMGGPGKIMVDGSLRYSDSDAQYLADFLAEHGAVWFEEPFAPDAIDSYRRLREVASVPIAAGENETAPRGFEDLIRGRLVDIVQPDVSRAGGVTAVLRIAKAAKAAGIAVATHSWSDAVGLIANAHVVAAVPNAMTVEVDRTGNGLIDELTQEPLRLVNGRLVLSEQPGLGIELREGALEKYRLPRGDAPPAGNYSDMTFGPGVDGQLPRYRATMAEDPAVGPTVARQDGVHASRRKHFGKEPTV
jgi:L-alanine-DL-glutamate epimerase-like enolase superfamily enzyme